MSQISIRGRLAALSAAIGLALSVGAVAAPTFVNGVVFAGNSVDATRVPGANQGRLGMFSDLYFDEARGEWWALSDRGPGGGLLDYATRVQRMEIDFDERSGAIRKARVKQTVAFTDPRGLLSAPTSGTATPAAFNGQNPLLLNGDRAQLGRSFDPEGLVVDPRSGDLIVADEYGPSVYVFNRRGQLQRVFETPANLVPRAALGGVVDYVETDRTKMLSGRQDNRGFEGLAVTPDGKRLVAVLQDPVLTDPSPANARNGRNVRVVVYDNDRRSANYGKGIAQYAYQLEAQADVLARIVAAGGLGSSTDPRQGRNIGVGAIVALNNTDFLVLERDNRGLGVDDPAGANVVGSKRVYRISLAGATDVSGVASLGQTTLAADIIPVLKSPMLIDLAANSVLPNSKTAEKWEGLAVGPRLKGGARVLVAGNDNDYSVTQTGAGTQYDVYVDFTGASTQRDIDSPSTMDGVEVGLPPTGYSLIPGVLHAYRLEAADLAGYKPPRNHD